MSNIWKSKTTLQKILAITIIASLVAIIVFAIISMATDNDIFFAIMMLCAGIECIISGINALTNHSNTAILCFIGGALIIGCSIVYFCSIS